MNNVTLTDQEFRHYQELTNMDPVVQRLCQMGFVADTDLYDQIDDLNQQLDDLSGENDDLRWTIEELQSDVRALEQKILVWETLEK